MTHWTPIQGLKEYGRVLGRKVGLSALGWLLLYFLSQKFRYPGEGVNILMLFAPMLGALGGLVIGWYLSTNAVEDSGMTGMTLWLFLVLGSWVAIGLVELVFWVFWKPPAFGGWMMMMSGMILAMATAVWHASGQE